VLEPRSVSTESNFSEIIPLALIRSPDSGNIF
jgi:hypothetical protein